MQLSRAARAPPPRLRGSKLEEWANQWVDEHLDKKQKQNLGSWVVSRFKKGKAAIDIANQISAGHPPPNEAEIVHAARLGGTVHVKDLDPEKAYVPVGQGVIDHAGSLSTILNAAPGGDLPIVLETHMPHVGPAATAGSLVSLRRILGGTTNGA